MEKGIFKRLRLIFHVLYLRAHYIYCILTWLFLHRLAISFPVTSLHLQTVMMIRQIAISGCIIWFLASTPFHMIVITLMLISLEVQTQHKSPGTFFSLCLIISKIIKVHWLPNVFNFSIQLVFETVQPTWNI